MVGFSHYYVSLPEGNHSLKVPPICHWNIPRIPRSTLFSAQASPSAGVETLAASPRWRGANLMESNMHIFCW